MRLAMLVSFSLTIVCDLALSGQLQRTILSARFWNPVMFVSLESRDIMRGRKTEIVLGSSSSMAQRETS